MGLLEDARKKNSSGSLLRKYRSKFDISDDSINETLSSIKTTMENDRLKTVYESQGVGDVQNQIAEKEKPAEGFLGIGLFSGAQRDYRDIFKREEKDKEYTSQIQKNSKTIAELLKKKNENPDKANDYNVMVQALQDKNKMLVEATGGDIKDLSTGKLALRSVETATDVMPFGAGITQAGRAVLKSGTKAVIGSLAKEGAATGIIGGAATAGQRENTTLSQFLGDVATSAIVSAATTVGLGLGMNKLGDKVGNWLRGDKVDFTPKEKDALADVPELQDEALFEQAGIESPIKKTDDDLMSETVSSTNNPETIAEILKTKIPDEQTRAKVSKQLEVIEDPDEVKRIIDSYDPVKIREDLALKIATTDNEKRIASFLKGIVSDDDIPTLSRTMKGMEDETQITKLLDEFQIKGESVIESPKVDVTPVENVTDTKTVEKKNIPESPLLKESKIGDVLTQVNKGGELIDVTRENYSKYRDILPRRTRQELDTKAQYNPEWNKGKQAQGGAESTLLQEAKKYSTPEEFVKAQGTPESRFEYHLSTDGKLPEGKTFGDLPKSNEAGVRGGSGSEVFSSKNPAIWHSQLGYEGLGKTPDNVYLVEVRNPQTTKIQVEGGIPKSLQTSNLPSDVRIVKNLGKVDGSFDAGLFEFKKDKALTDLWKQAQGEKKISKKTTKPEPKKEESKSDKPNKSGLVKTLEKTAENRGVKLKKEEIPRLASKMKMDDETKKAFKFYAEDTQKAIEMAIKGEAPEGVRVGSLYTAVRDTAIIQNDIDTLYRLRSAGEAKGAIEAAAEAGRDVKAYDSAIMSDPVKIMRQVDDLKKQIAEKSGVDIKKDVKSAEEEIATFIEKNASTDADLSKLVQKITC